MTARIRPWRIYVAGPLTVGHREANVNRAMDVAADLIAAGYAVCCPHLSHFLDLRRPLPYQTWLRHDLEWLPLCDLVLRLPGVSPGADAEQEVAAQLGIPVALLDPERPAAEQIAAVLP